MHVSPHNTISLHQPGLALVFLTPSDAHGRAGARARPLVRPLATPQEAVRRRSGRLMIATALLNHGVGSASGLCWRRVVLPSVHVRLALAGASRRTLGRAAVETHRRQRTVGTSPAAAALALAAGGAHAALRAAAQAAMLACLTPEALSAHASRRGVSTSRIARTNAQPTAIAPGVARRPVACGTAPPALALAAAVSALAAPLALAAIANAPVSAAVDATKPFEARALAGGQACTMAVAVVWALPHIASGPRPASIARARAVMPAAAAAVAVSRADRTRAIHAAPSRLADAAAAATDTAPAAARDALAMARAVVRARGRLRHRAGRPAPSGRTDARAPARVAPSVARSGALVASDHRTARPFAQWPAPSLVAHARATQRVTRAVRRTIGRTAAKAAARPVPGWRALAGPGSRVAPAVARARHAGQTAAAADGGAAAGGRRPRANGAEQLLASLSAASGRTLAAGEGEWLEDGERGGEGDHGGGAVALGELHGGGRVGGGRQRDRKPPLRGAHAKSARRVHLLTAGGVGVGRRRGRRRQPRGGRRRGDALPDPAARLGRSGTPL